MGGCVSQARKLYRIYFFTIYVDVVEGHNTCILHCAPVELRYVDLIILAERERILKEILVHGHAFVCHFEEEVGDAS